MSGPRHDAGVNDIRIGRSLRAIRHRRGWRQQDVADRAGVSQDLVSNIENGRIDGVLLRRLRAVGRALDADVTIGVWWRAGEIDRLLDEGHAALSGQIAVWLERAGWEVRPEVTFAVRAERGSIDLLAWHAPSRTLLVVEIKTELTSIEETLRRHDAKARIAAVVAAEQFGWRSRSISRLLVLPDTSTARRRVARHEAVLGRAYALRSAELRRWLRRPQGAASGLLFASPTTGGRGRRWPISRKRIRRRQPSVVRAA